MKNLNDAMAEIENRCDHIYSDSADTMGVSLEDLRKCMVKMAAFTINSVIPDNQPVYIHMDKLEFDSKGLLKCGYPDPFGLGREKAISEMVDNAKEFLNENAKRKD